MAFRKRLTEKPCESPDVKAGVCTRANEAVGGWPGPAPRKQRRSLTGRARQHGHRLGVMRPALNASGGPRLALGVTDHIWTVAELIEAATTDEAPEPEGRRVGRLWVINGGLA